MVPLMVSASRAQWEKPAGDPTSHYETRASRQAWRRPREEPDATHSLMLAESREGIREPARGEDGLDALTADFGTALAREEQADAHVREEPGALRHAGILCQREAGRAPAGTSGRQTVLPDVFGVNDMGLLAMLSFDLHILNPMYSVRSCLTGFSPPSAASRQGVRVDGVEDTVGAIAFDAGIQGSLAIKG